MPHCIINHDQQRMTVEVPAGMTVGALLKQLDILLPMPCSAKGICGQCKVNITGEVSSPSVEERNLLGDRLIQQNIRLACHTIIKGDTELFVCASQPVAQIKLGSFSDTNGINPLFYDYGVAIDIGTTTIVAQLYDAQGLLAQVGRKNPQDIYGADVISRIESSLNGASASLATLMRNELNDMMRELCRYPAIALNAIDTAIITGNTTMLFLLCGDCVDSLSRAPFQSSRLFGEILSPSQLNLQINPKGKVYLPLCLSAFVGADITTAILSSNLLNHEDPQLLLDIGTNGEMALWHENHLYVCSTAAGPAFEGVGIHMGMQGVPGAIEHIACIGNEWIIDIIGNTSPQGICGSGVIDVVAMMLAVGIIDETGVIQPTGHLFESRINRDPKQLSFRLASHVIITQKDIRMVQLAKSAIYSGVLTLLRESKVDLHQLGRACIAGGFGSYLNIKNAVDIGLLPNGLTSSITVIGNAALDGAAKILLHKHLWNDHFTINQQVIIVDLSTNSFFSKTYIEQMLF